MQHCRSTRYYYRPVDSTGKSLKFKIVSGGVLAEKTVADVLIDLGTQLAEIDEVRAFLLDQI